MPAQSYKIAKHQVNKLNGYLRLNKQYNVKNTIRLAEDLTKLIINEHHKMLTYDIKDLYVNIPIKETLMITKSILLKHNDTQVTKQNITLLETILQQNYFSFENNLLSTGKRHLLGIPYFPYNS
jgi:sulfur relay (sulfurtransferase) DsrC/TusE family protein